MRRVLLVTSSYAPTTIADMHRARHLAWELPKLGWDAELLYPGVAFQRVEYVDDDSDSLFNPHAACHEVAPQSDWLFRLLKMRTIGVRAFLPLYRAGRALLRSRKFDLVYITTANFPLFCLGRRWARMFNVPYVLDYHDPWVRDTEPHHTTDHTVKRNVWRVLSRRLEREALEGAAGIVSVSPVYLDELRSRYGSLRCLQAGRCEAIPFAASERDLAAAARATASPASCEIVYVGAGGPIMVRSFATLCGALAEVRRSNPELLATLKIRILGTYPFWREGSPKPLHAIAVQHGLGDLVEEQPRRLTYMQAMEAVRRSDGLLVLGVDDAGYVPSKLFTCALSGKPLLACFRDDSPAIALFDRMPALGNLMTFPEAGGRQPDTGADVMRRFLTQIDRGERFDRQDLLADYLAPAMARRHVALFERICAEEPAA